MSPKDIVEFEQKVFIYLKPPLHNIVGIFNDLNYSLVSYTFTSKYLFTINFVFGKVFCTKETF